MLIAPQFTKLSLATYCNAPNLSAKSIIPFLSSVSIIQTRFDSQEMDCGGLTLRHFLLAAASVRKWMFRFCTYEGCSCAETQSYEALVFCCLSTILQDMSYASKNYINSWTSKQRFSVEMDWSACEQLTYIQT